MFESIVAAATRKTDEFSVVIEDGVLQAAIKAAQVEINKQESEKLGKDLIKLLQLCKNAVDNNVAQIRSIRRQEAEQLKKLASLNRAREYGNETGNFVPLGIALSVISVLDADKKLRDIPKDWKPKTSKKSK